MPRATPLVLALATPFVLALMPVFMAAAASARALLQDSAGDCDDPLPFVHVLTGEPLSHYKPDEEITPAVDEFHCSGENPYDGDEEAAASGKPLFRLCAGCHMPDGTGRIGPSLVDDQHKYPRVATDHGEFEVIYGGAAGAMQPFGRRFTQDEILRIMTYVEELKKAN
ncbi:MAG TPA: c-type cytochrome [Propylenella sp.]